MSEKVIKKDRESNFELLRCISMFMIIILHMLSNCMILSGELSPSYNLGWALESFSIVAANLYILISGYFSVKSTFSWKKVFKLWLTVLFYSIGLAAILYLFKDKFNLAYQGNFIKLVLFPVTQGEYWFVTVYLMLYMLSPFLNVLANNLKKNEYRNMIIVSVCGLTLLKTVFPTSYTFDKTGGYGIIWFVLLYLIAGYIRLHYDLKINKYLYLLSYVLCSSLIAFMKLGNDYLNMPSFFENYSAPVFNYNHILVLISCLSLFLFFRELKIKSKFINVISKATFGIYLIHEEFFVRTALWGSIIPLANHASSKFLILYILGYALIIYTCATLIELARIYIVKFFYKKFVTDKIVE